MHMYWKFIFVHILGGVILFKVGEVTLLKIGALDWLIMVTVGLLKKECWIC